MSYKIIIDSKNEISLPPFIPGTHQISTLKIMSCLENFQTFPSAPPQKKTSQANQSQSQAPVSRRAPPSTPRPFSGLDGVFLGMGRSLMEAED